MSVGKNIKKYREKKGYSLNKLSELSGVKYKTLWKIETGEVKDTTLPKALKIREALGITLDQLYEEEKEE